MKYFLYIVITIFICVSCSKPFDIRSYDQLSVENNNSMVEDLAVLNDMISYDALSDSITLYQFDEQSKFLKLKIETSLNNLKQENVPNELENYRNSLVNLFELYLSLVNHDILFTSLDPDDVGFKIDSFAYVHDEINSKILLAVDTFDQERQEVLTEVKNNE